MRQFAAIAILLALASVAPAQTTAPLVAKNFSGGRAPNGVENPYGRESYTDCNFSTQTLERVNGPWPADDPRHWRAHVIQFTGNPDFYHCNFTGTYPSEGTLVPSNPAEGILGCNVTISRKRERTTTQTAVVNDAGTTITFRWMGYRNRILGRTHLVTGEPIYKATPDEIDVEPPPGARVYRSQRVLGEMRTQRIGWQTMQDDRAKLEAGRVARELPTNDEVGL